MSPYKQAHCESDIKENLVCRLKVATKTEHCLSKLYNPNADEKPINKTTVLNETTKCSIQKVCTGPNNTAPCNDKAVCVKHQCVFESIC